MSVEDDVDNVLYGKEEQYVKEKPKRTFSRRKVAGGFGFLGICLVVYVLFSNMGIPFFERKEDFEELISVDNNLVDVGDEQWNPEGEPYHYTFWESPENTFGIKNTTIRETNYSYFWGMFYNHTEWTLWESNNGNSWSQADEQGALNITKIRSSDNASDKVIINFTCPATAYYQVRFNISADATVYNNETYQYNLTYQVNDTENYSVIFNWYDLVNSSWGDDLTYEHGVYNSTFMFNTTTINKITKNTFISWDPWFGDQSDSAGTWGLSDDVGFTNFANTQGTGYANNITVLMRNRVASTNVQCALYYNSNNSQVNNGLTDVRNLPNQGGYTWQIFYFNGTQPLVENNTNYHICVGTEASNTVLSIATTGGDSAWDKNCNIGGMTWTDPIPEDNNYAYEMDAYCSFTLSGGEEDVNETQLIDDNFYTGGNDTVKTQNIFDYFYTGGTPDSSTQQIFNYFYTGGDSPSTQNIFDYFYTGGDISPTQQIFDYFYTGGTPSSSTQNIFDYFFTGGDVSSTTNIFEYFYTGGNTTPTPSQTQQIFNYYYRGGNTTELDIITVHPEVYFDIESDTERYHCNQTMNFSNIVLNESWIRFNYTSFNITAPSFINNSLTFIDPTPLVSVDGDMILGFWSNSSSGTVWYNISGFENNANYYVTKDGTDYVEVVSNATGVVHFSDTVNDNRRYEIYNGTLTNTQQIFNYFYTGGTPSSSTQNIFDYFYTGGTSDSSTQNIFDYYYTGGNSHSTTNIFEYFYTGGNTTPAPAVNQTQQIFNYFYTGGDVSPTTQIHNYFYTGGNTTVLPVTISDEYPANQSNITSLQPTLYFTLNSSNGTVMDYYVYNGSTLLFNDTGVSNDTFYVDWNEVVNYTRYNWDVCVLVGSTWTNVSYYFTAQQAGGGGQTVTGFGAAIALAAGAMLISVAVMLGLTKRRKK